MDAWEIALQYPNLIRSKLRFNPNEFHDRRMLRCQVELNCGYGRKICVMCSVTERSGVWAVGVLSENFSKPQEGHWMKYMIIGYLYRFSLFSTRKLGRVGWLLCIRSKHVRLPHAERYPFPAESLLDAMLDFSSASQWLIACFDDGRVVSSAAD